MYYRAAELDEQLSEIITLWAWMVGIWALLLAIFGEAYIAESIRSLGGTIFGIRLHSIWGLWTDIGLYPFYLFFVLLLMAGMMRNEVWMKKIAIGYFTVQFFFAFLVVRIIKITSGRARPGTDLAEHGGDNWIGLTLDSAFHSFPSGHTADVMVGLIFCSVLLPKKWMQWVCLIWVVSVALSRIILSRHYPLDLLVGAVIGGLPSIVILKYWIFPLIRREELAG